MVTGNSPVSATIIVDPVDDSLQPHLAGCKHKPNLYLFNKQLYLSFFGSKTVTDPTDLSEVSDGLICYSPDLSRFDYLCKTYFTRLLFEAPPNPWLKICTQHDFVNYCQAALRVYAHLSYSYRYAPNNYASDSPTKIQVTTGFIHVPIYIQDLIREVCRPMYAGKIDLLPYFPLTRNGIGIVPGLGWLQAYNQISWIIKQFTTAVPVTIVSESPGKAPLYVSGDTSFACSYDNLPNYRIEAMNLLRHFRPRTHFYLGHPNKNNVPVPPVPYQPRQISNALVTTCAQPAIVLFETKVFNDADPEVITDAAGNTIPAHEFVLGHELTMKNSPVIAVNGIHYHREPVALEHFDYGQFAPAFVHAFFSACNPTDADLENRDIIRSIFSFGPAFRHDVVIGLPPISVRFPSDANASQISNITMMQNRNRKTKKRKNFKKSTKNKQLNDVADAETVEHTGNDD